MSNFSGMGYPIMATPKGYFPVITDAQLIKGDLLILLMTYPGERVMMPEFGTPLRDLVFEPNDVILADRARNMIISSISKWEPRIKIDSIDVMIGVDNANRGFLNPNDDLTQINSILGIQIVFRDPNDIRTVQELVLQVPLQRGVNNVT